MSDPTFTRAATAADAGRALRQAVNAASRASEAIALCVRDGFAFTRGDLAGFRSQLAELRASVDAIEARIMPGAPLMAPDAPAGVHVLSDVAEAAADLVAEAGGAITLPGYCAGCGKVRTFAALCNACLDRATADPLGASADAGALCARCRVPFTVAGTRPVRGVDGLMRHAGCDGRDRADRMK